MSNVIQCPNCGGSLKTQQIDYRKSHYCDRCGALPYRDGKPETGRGHLSERPTKEAAE